MHLTSPIVSVGIVTYNSRDHVDACFKSLAQQTFTGIEVVIIDNASSDFTADWIAEHWRQHRLVRNPTNVGFGRAHNQIIALTRGDYYMPLNPDVTLSPTYIEALVEAIQSSPDIGWVCGKVLFANRDDTPLDIVYSVGHAVFLDGYAINIGFKEPDNRQYEQAREVFGANGACPLYRRKMLVQLSASTSQVFDESIFLYGEDVELDWRARMLGWRCFYAPSAVGYHAHGASAGDMQWAILKHITANRYYTVFKNGFLFDILTYNLPAFFGHMLFMLVTEPSRGVATITSVLSRIGAITRYRRRMKANRRMSRKDLHRWFEWSRQHRGLQPSNYFERFWRSRIRRHLRIVR